MGANPNHAVSQAPERPVQPEWMSLRNMNHPLLGALLGMPAGVAAPQQTPALVDMLQRNLHEPQYANPHPGYLPPARPGDVNRTFD